MSELIVSRMLDRHAVARRLDVQQAQRFHPDLHLASRLFNCGWTLCKHERAMVCYAMIFGSTL
jgi:hypothetical protein